MSAETTPTPPVQTQPVLPYADAATRWGVSAQTSNGVTRIVVPPLPGWRYLHGGLYASGTLLAVALGIFSVAALRRPDPAAIPALAFVGIALFLVLLMAFFRLRRRLMLEVDQHQLSIRTSHPWLVAPRAWPRASVAEVRQNRTTGKLMVRITGKDHVDVFVSPVHEVTAWVARTVDDALRGTPGSATSSPRAERGVPGRGWRIVLIATGCAMIAGAIGLCFLGFPWVILAVYVLIFSAAPFGLALGTQEKEFYL